MTHQPSEAPIQEDPEEIRLLADPRLAEAINLFNEGSWYACHDGFEELWHETQGPCRVVLQGVLQAAVAQLHLERGNRRGATILIGESLGRLQNCGDLALGLELAPLRQCLKCWLESLQREEDTGALASPHLNWSGGSTPVN